MTKYILTLQDIEELKNLFFGTEDFKIDKWLKNKNMLDVYKSHTILAPIITNKKQE